MKKYYKSDDWCIIEEGFSAADHLASESAFSLGNEYFGQRANFEEFYSGESLQGSYIGGVYYPDKTKVGWWKNGYPDYFAKILNAPNWIGVHIKVNGQMLDLNTLKTENFQRVLNMKEGYLDRSFTAEFENGNKVQVKAQRFLSLVDRECGFIKYQIKCLNFDGKVEILPLIDADVINKEANYEKHLWNVKQLINSTKRAHVITKSKKLDFEVCTSMAYSVHVNKELVNDEATEVISEKSIGQQLVLDCKSGDLIDVYKYATVVNSMNYKAEELIQHAQNNLDLVCSKGFDKCFKEHSLAWTERWSECDIKVEGDQESQQAIRFNIFQLLQTYAGHDHRLNVGPKGFTGEKYGGGAYWDTEAFCMPFYLGTSDPSVARNLLLYRYHHLENAKKNAQKLGFNNGAALYPMVTMNGEECHNEWEITFEEIHRNGAIAYAIYNYVNYTGDQQYLVDYGLEVLVAISRFWAQRFNFSEARKQYVMLGVTGPNEYENNVNNNWYTSKIAQWCMVNTSELIKFFKDENLTETNEMLANANFNFDEELATWDKIASNIYFPTDKNEGVFLQQDGFLDKDLRTVDTLSASERPLNQHWSWDRILRSCFIKQADVLQGIYFLEDQFDLETIRKNFDFYEPMTVHESSLSPSLHAVIGCKLGYTEKAYDMFLRSARYDLDDYNNELAAGCHITSMAGTWLSVIEGFGGRRVRNGQLALSPCIPKAWKSYEFKITFREQCLNVKVNHKEVILENISSQEMKVELYDDLYSLDARSTSTFSIK